MRSRRLLPLLAVAALGLAACGTPGSEPASTTAPPAEATAPTQATPGDTTATSATPGADSCATLVAGLPIEDQVGQLFMVGKATGEPVDATYRQVLAESRAGHIVLLGNSTAGSDAVKELTDDLRAAAAEPEGVKLFVAVDQEGGQIQRLQGPGFDTMPAA
ncbi:MAG: glycoside hydrolase family 3 N-terminal domain-containing protein, partial [Propionibacteriaceae bacterium]|nr:glycoside hydrolase family 3 N-terminal domain-containing protein [Propionibacteriaceae bacterium]